MVTIGRIPHCLSSFFRPQRRHFSKPAWPHFRGLLMAMAMGTEHTIERLNALLRGHGHRTNDGEFLWRSHFDEAGVLQGIALRLLNRVCRSGEPIYFILDDTQTLKRAKKMDAVGKLYHHSEKRYATGHTILKACLYCNGVTIPWGSWLYVKKEHAGKLKIPFATLTELAAEAVRGLPLPPTTDVTVLFDAYYLCSTVARAVDAKGWHYIGVGKSNRRFTFDGRSHHLKTYGANILRRGGRWMNITGLQKTHSYRVARRTGSMKKLGAVQVVFSRRRGDAKAIALVTNDLARPAKRVVADYLRRWTIELLIKDEKQHLGLGAYRVLRYRAVVSTTAPLARADARKSLQTLELRRTRGSHPKGSSRPQRRLAQPPVSKGRIARIPRSGRLLCEANRRCSIRHLHLVDCAYACLTHLGMNAQGAQGHPKNKTVLRLPTIRQLKAELRQAVWNEAVKDVVKVSHERPVIRRLEKLLAA